MVIAATVLITVVIVLLGVSTVSHGAFRGRSYREASYGAVKQRARSGHEARARIRDEAAVEAVETHWRPHIRKHEKKARKDTRRAARALQRGKDPSKYILRS